MVLTDVYLKELLLKKKLIITPFPSDESIRSTHIDLHLDERLLKYSSLILDLKNPDINFAEIQMSDSGFTLAPGEFILGSTLETVEIPNGYQGFIETKGNIARAGIQSHNTDGHIDPGFKGKITLEIKNNSHHSIIIYPGMLFVQIYIFECSSLSENPYRGKYQNQKGATIYQID
ncbi:MAG: dCTP deaminase [Candidatus Absconditabacteria bacterium]|nr:dCTP deaminase [Candidatus Absconditabacteria bacterium]MDD3868510.1 dCTP deaminase [Candidatus Absconditabacteria bacterium]MDD4713894.1 dCTP deaminase [Candidatus Absconditabacteria bacterium]